MNPIVEWKNASDNFMAAYPYNFAGLYTAASEMFGVWSHVKTEYVDTGREFDFILSAPEEVEPPLILAYGALISHSTSVMLHALGPGESHDDIMILDEELLTIVFENMHEYMSVFGEFIHG